MRGLAGPMNETALADLICSSDMLGIAYAHNLWRCSLVSMGET